MAYSELIKSFSRIRDYMRQFYVYGFRSRDEYAQKSARSYDNERRRIESWLGDYMRFHQDATGKNVFLSVDSRQIPHNPLYNAFKAKSFTDRDIVLHFAILDILADGKALSTREICDRITQIETDESTVRKKLREYETLGLFRSEKNGRELLYSVNRANVNLDEWQEALHFFTEANALGVVGSYLLDRFHDQKNPFRFKHHYILQALESEVLYCLLQAIHEHRVVKLEIFSLRHIKGSPMIIPVRIRVSAQEGRCYVVGWHINKRCPVLYRLDRVLSVEPLEKTERFEQCCTWIDHFEEHLWGASAGFEPSLDHLEMVVHIDEHESFIVDRLEREKRCGQVEELDGSRILFRADVYDALEMLPWLRTFTGRIEKLTCSNYEVVRRFYSDLADTHALYASNAACGSRKGDFMGRNRITAAHTYPESTSKAGTSELFHEVYGTYYRVVSEILHEDLQQSLNNKRVHEIVQEKGFGESTLNIPASLLNGDWPLLDTLTHAPAMPLTLLEKRWMKSIALDKRSGLFGLPTEGLEDTEPLFTPDVFHYYDQYTDGDPYDDPAYIQHFRLLLRALREKRYVILCFTSHRGRECCWKCVPLRMEYSLKDDKFRIIIRGRGDDTAINVGRITAVRVAKPYPPEEWHEAWVREKKLVFELRDERNALERVLMHFSHFQKETEQLHDDLYKVTLFYNCEDETELLIRILSFGPVIKVLAPDDLIASLASRLQKQQELAVARE